MAKELVSVNENLSVINCVREIESKLKRSPEYILIYVTNSKNRLLGRLSLKDLLTRIQKLKLKRYIYQRRFCKC